MSHDFGESNFDFKLGAALFQKRRYTRVPQRSLGVGLVWLENWMHGIFSKKRTLEIIGDNLECGSK